MESVAEKEWFGSQILDRLTIALASAPPDNANPKTREKWLEDTANDLNFLSSDVYRSTLPSAPSRLAALLCTILNDRQSLVAELSIPAVGVLHAAMQEFGKNEFLQHETWEEPAFIAISGLPALVQLQVKRNRPRNAIVALEFAASVLESYAEVASDDKNCTIVRPNWVEMCRALLDFVRIVEGGGEDSNKERDSTELGPWLLNTHAKRVALGSLLVAPASEIHDSLPLLFTAADTGARLDAVSAQEELASDCLAAIVGQNFKSTKLLGGDTAVLLFVAMHTHAQACGSSNAWHCWILPSLERAATGKGIGIATNALGIAGALCESRQVACASGTGSLGDLLTALERVAKSDEACDLHDLANAVGARVFHQYREMCGNANNWLCQGANVSSRIFPATKSYVALAGFSYGNSYRLCIICELAGQ